MMAGAHRGELVLEFGELAATGQALLLLEDCRGLSPAF
jgi:hypothetical protein